MNAENNVRSTTRRDFLKTSGTAVAAAAFAGTLTTPRAGYCAENNNIKVALVGCGGRGTGAAANALSTTGPTQLWAVADVFAEHAENALANLAKQHSTQVAVAPERKFVGFDGFKQAIDSLGKGDLVILATPPAFRPMHFEYAVQRGVNVFMEKSFAVDAPGIRRVLKAGELAAQKGLKVAGGLMSRHYEPLELCVKQIHDGAIGEVITAWAYRMHGPVGFKPRREGRTELAHQISNYSCFTWLNGSFFVDWLIHNIDVCCWVKNTWPVSAQGQGGRQVRADLDQLFDHQAVEFTFADGTRMFGQGRHMNNCHDFFGDIIHGAKGSAILGEGQTKPRLFKGWNQTVENLIWEFKGAAINHYQREHDLLFDAIRNNKPYNETERCAKSCMTAILGRMAFESGQKLTFDEALASNVQLAPGFENIKTLDDPAPVAPRPDGSYPLAVPGKTKVI